MNPLKQGLLHLYCSWTAAARERRILGMLDAGVAPISVLFYHRVADTHPNAWTMPTRLFQRQIDWLSGRFEFITLDEAQRRLKRRESYRQSVVLTFDDGYAENCESAIPLLLRRHIPFTYFITTQNVREQASFTHDVNAGQPLKPNSIAELRAMADAGAEIGAHTRTHPDLGSSTDAAWLDDEIAGSKEDLEQWIGRRVRYFAFPFGMPENTTPEAFAAIARAGFEGVCTAYGAYNLPERVRQDLGAFHLRRIHADSEWARFKNWMTIDPRGLGPNDPIDDQQTLRYVVDARRAAKGRGAGRVAPDAALEEQLI